MHILKMNYNGNPNVGLYFYANDNYCLAPVGISDSLMKEIEEVLKVPVYKAKAAGTDLLGVFFAGNNDVLFVPKIMFDSELKALDKLKIKHYMVDSELTALGNNMVVTESMSILNPDYHDNVVEFVSRIVPAKKGQIAGLNIVGSLASANRTHAVVSPDITEGEEKFFEKNLKLNITKTTVNFGSQFVSSGIVCNSHGFLVGDMSGGPEVQNIDIGLGFLEG